MILCSDARLKSFAFVNPPHAMSAVARRHTARPTSLEAEATAVASPSRSISSASYGPARTSRIALRAFRTIDRAYPAHADAINAAPPLMPPRHPAIAPLLPPYLASPARPTRPSYLILWHHHCSGPSYRASMHFPPYARARLNGDHPRKICTPSLVSGPRTHNVTGRRRALAVLRKSYDRGLCFYARSASTFAVANDIKNIASLRRGHDQQDTCLKSFALVNPPTPHAMLAVARRHTARPAPLF
ncbi:hypothetical protein FB451DRAFT_1566656 [Mycena latifolia]|nr:hypothetical protein FB451DRAFT_1566656 [Mycena latifolia]